MNEKKKEERRKEIKTSESSTSKAPKPKDQKGNIQITEQNKINSPHLSSEWNTLPSKYDVLTVIFLDGVQNISFGFIGIFFPGRHFLLSGTTSDVVLG